MDISKTNIEKSSPLNTKDNKIVGLSEQTLELYVKSAISDSCFFAFIDDTEVDVNIRILADGKTTKIETCLPKKYRNIKIIYLKNNKYYLQYEFKNTIIKKIGYRLRLIFNSIKLAFSVIIRGIKFMWREHHFLVPLSLWKKYFLRFFTRVKEGSEILWNPFIQNDYNRWIKNEKNEVFTDLEYQPLFSILIPVYNIKCEYLNLCVQSILDQLYQNFEVILVDDASSSTETLDALKQIEKSDQRIIVKYREKNGHISQATNDALELAKGEFICLMDNDDVLSKDALYEVAKVLNENKLLDFIYSDEDKLDIKGNRCEPHFKPDFSPDTLMGINYICHFAVIRKIIMEEVNGFTIGLEGAQDHDLFLRISEKTNKIYHISKILYHWRMIEGSTSMEIGNKNYAILSGIKTIENALSRRNIKGTVTNVLNSTVYSVEYSLDREVLVSVIIPTKDLADITEKCLESIYEKTNYSNYEIIMVDNNSVEQETFNLFEKYKKLYKNFKVVKADMEFNYSKINNLAVQYASGEVLIFLNNDTEIITSDWMKLMSAQAIQKHTGAVGAKLLYADMTIQHAGVILGLGGGVACHAYLEANRSDKGMYGRLLIPYNYSAVTAACLAVEKSKFIKVKGFEESLKVAYNDIDLNLKLLSEGYYNVLLPKVEIIHYESKSRGLDSTSEKYKLFLNESNYMLTKWGESIKSDPFYNSNFSKKGLFLLDRNNAEESKDEI